MKKAIIFDMDGLMINSERLSCQIYTDVLHDMQLPFTETFYTSFLGKTKEQVYELLKQRYGIAFPVDALWEEVHQRLDKCLAQAVPLKKGITKLLNDVKAQGYRTAVATSSERKRAECILRKAGLISWLDEMICGDEVQKGKPDPEIFLIACRKLGIVSEKAIVLEDSEAGILAADRAHIDVICIPDMKYPDPMYQEMALAVLDSLSDVIPFLKQLNKK